MSSKWDGVWFGDRQMNWPDPCDECGHSLSIHTPEHPFPGNDRFRCTWQAECACVMRWVPPWVK